MRFNDENLVIINTMSKAEAKAFIKFLESEIIRHRRDVYECFVLIHKVEERFEL